MKHIGKLWENTSLDGQAPLPAYPILQSKEAVLDLLQPVQELEFLFLEDADFLKGLFWGTPRYGHPEGQIALHVREVLNNIDALNLPDTTYQQLRLIAFAHDTFKFLESRQRPRDWSKHHGMLARNFVARFTDDLPVLDILELHDEAFYCWRMIQLYQKPKKGYARFDRLLERMGENLQLYYLFFRADTQTGDKTQAPLVWFESIAPSIQVPDAE